MTFRINLAVVLGSVLLINSLVFIGSGFVTSDQTATAICFVLVNGWYFVTLLRRLIVEVDICMEEKKVTIQIWNFFIRYNQEYLLCETDIVMERRVSARGSSSEMLVFRNPRFNELTIAPITSGWTPSVLQAIAQTYQRLKHIDGAPNN